MSYVAQNPASVLICNLRVLAFGAALTVLTVQPAQAQTYQVLHHFTAGADGSSPYAGLTMDRAGNLYGTAVAGGRGFGVVFQLSHRGSGWIFKPLYSFTGGANGEGPIAGVVVGPNGSLYGTTYGGGNQGCGGAGCGTVFNLRPPTHFCSAISCPWNQTVLYRFNGGADAANPLFSSVTFDSAGNMYGTTQNGGGSGCGGPGCGTVYQLSPNGSSWTEHVLYSFTGGGDGASPNAGLTLDAIGSLYGTTKMGGANSNGTVFKLSHSGSGWTQSVVHEFQGGANDGFWPVGGLIFDSAGNLYGTTNSGGSAGGGTAFEIPAAGSESVLFNFAGGLEGGAYDNLVMDAAGNLYGTTYDDGAFDHGSVFKLTPTQGGWMRTELYAFTGGIDGRCPYGRVVIDAQGNLYGTTEAGGNFGAGVVWEITP